MARVSAGSGPYLSLMSTLAIACSPLGARVMSWTLPTETPEMRTSDCWASWVASLKGTLISYGRALNGVGPPKVIQRKSRMPKQESAKPAITSSWVVLGARLLILFPAHSRQPLGPPVGFLAVLRDAARLRR